MSGFLIWGLIYTLIKIQVVCIYLCILRIGSLTTVSNRMPFGTKYMFVCFLIDVSLTTREARQQDHRETKQCY